MAWVKLDDSFPEHRKLAELGAYAPLCGWLYVCGLAYCNRQLTDGVIPKAYVNRLAGFEHLAIETGGNELMGHLDTIESDDLAAMLVQAGLWEDEGRQYRIHDYLEYQPSRETVLKERSQVAERKARWRERRGNGVPNGGTTAVPNTVPNAQGHASRTPEERRKNAPPDPDPDPERGEEQAPPRRSSSLIARGESLKFDRQVRARHANCHPEVCRDRDSSVRVCMPAGLVPDLAAKLVGMSPEAAVADVLRWARAHAPAAGDVIESSEFKYWNRQWDQARAKATTSVEPPIRRAKDWIADMDRKTAEARRG